MLTKNDFVTEADFEAICKPHPYYAGRWQSFQEVIDMLVGKDFNKVIEIGSYTFPLVKWAHTVDIKGTPNQFYDLDLYPWPFPDKQFDLLIALQTLEHLERRDRAFQEIKRVAKNAIISLPFEWNNPEDHVHFGITEDKISQWTGGEVPAVKLIKEDSFKRIVLFYNFK